MQKKSKFKNVSADLFIPDSATYTVAVNRTTHMAIGAHQDDIELMAFHGINKCFKTSEHWFAGVTVTDGRGSPRSGKYSDLTDKDMAAIRLHEQRKAAEIGEYSLQVQLAYKSESVKKGSSNLVKDLENLFLVATPKVVYLHSLFDKHGTHVSVAAAALNALKRLPAEDRPEKVYGVEIWGSLDWLPDNAKVVLNTSENDHLMSALIGVHDSQVAGGKRYDLAIKGRNQSNATFNDFGSVDSLSACQYAINLMPLLEKDGPDISDYANYLMTRYRDSVLERLKGSGY